MDCATIVLLLFYMNKTKPIGVRFDPEKLEFIKSREKLKSNQQVVDLLVNKYWWDHKLPIPTHKEAPPLHLKEGISVSDIGFSINETISSSYEGYEKEILNTTYSGDLQNVMKQIEANNELGAVKKAKLRAIANEHRVNFTN